MPDVSSGGLQGLTGRTATRRPPALRRPRSFDRLRSLVEGDLLPRLLLIHNAGPIPPALAARAARTLPGGESDQFLGLLTGGRPDDEVALFVTGLLDRGHSLDTVYVDLLAPAARRLGVLWAEDRCDFVEVTLACCQLQRVIRRLGRQLMSNRRAGAKGRVLVAGLPTEQHTLGPILVAELLGQDGWTVELGAPFAPTPPVEGIGLLAFSLARTDLWKAARERIADLRRRAGSQLMVMVGGAAFAEEPGLASRVGADGWAEDGKAVKALADRLCFP